MVRSITLFAGDRALFLGNLVSAGVGAALVGILSAHAAASRGVEGSLLPILVVACTTLVIVPRQPWCEVLSSASGTTLIAAASGLAALLVGAGAWLGLWPVIGADSLLMMWAGASIAGVVTFSMLRSARQCSRPLRLAIVGSAGSASDLAREASRSRPGWYEVVGCVRDAGAGLGEDGGRVLGEIADLSAIITTYQLDLLVLAPGASRLRVYDALASTCLVSAVPIVELADFYERAFGHVPVRAINSCWFQHVLAMDRAPSQRPSKRAADIVVATALGIASGPLLALLIVLIRHDGGPALFRQLRIGEGGRPFMILKLRTMRVQDRPQACWTAQQDPRITPLGRILRATHVDELPQLLNVLRGEMSIIGPRPEQPALAQHLVELVPHYQPRHMVKPGIAGWAQGRCGYAGSEDGSIWKVSHDLYYLRHRSIRFDFAILIETVYAMLLGDRLRSAVRSVPSIDDSAAQAILQRPSLESAVSTESSPMGLEAVARAITTVVSEPTE
jgi:exopolysaccharide biosynthesis polyprenyl glycosylphosphotransferase